MSLLSMFTRRKHPDVDKSDPPSTGFVRPVPATPVPRAAPDSAAPPTRRSERAARRELLFTVVRECMNRAGVLSASYKFKVLSLDARGRQFLVMVEIPGVQLRTPDRLAQIEAMVSQAAKAQHDIAVKAVYWRQNDHVAVDASNAMQAAAAAASKPAKPVAVAPEPVLADGSAYEPIDADEVTAFRQALAKGVRPERKPRPAAAQNYTLLTGFEQTEIREDKPADVLSGSQYGELR
jgi:hypothetical protein